jgi:hypothetical protein
MQSGDVIPKGRLAPILRTYAGSTSSLGSVGRTRAPA